MLTSRVAFFVLLMVTIFLIRGAWGVYQKQVQSSADLLRVKESLGEAQKREIELTQAIEHLQTSEGVEREIREKFNVARSGENVIMIVDEIQSSGLPELRKRSLFNFVTEFLRSLY